MVTVSRSRKDYRYSLTSILTSILQILKCDVDTAAVSEAARNNLLRHLDDGPVSIQPSKVRIQTVCLRHTNPYKPQTVFVETVCTNSRAT